MNRIERFIYDSVKRSPKIKFFLRNVYQSMFDLLPVKWEKSAYPITVREGHFFGFHDHSPFSADNTKLLSNHYTIPLRMPNPDDALELGFFNGDNFQIFHPITKTHAWNWHQGCKLQWVGQRNAFIFNDHENGQNVSRIYDLDLNKQSTLPASISSVSPCGTWAVGYSFARVQKYMPGYGYTQPTREVDLEHPHPETSGMYRVDIPSGEVTQLISISELAALDPVPSMEGAHHYVSHALCSPGGKRFVFMHRWVGKDIRKRYHRLYGCDADGSNLFRFPCTDMVSHIGWRDEDHIFAYCRMEKYDDCYALMKDGDRDDFQIIGYDSFSSDGHPSFVGDGRWFVTDTYPDRTRRRYLVLFDMVRNKRYNISYLKSPKRFASLKVGKHWQCDLHPRWDRTGRYVCFDSTHTNKRALCTIDLGATVQENTEPHTI